MNIRRQSANFQLEEDPFSKNVQGIGKMYHEVLLLMKILQNKSQAKNLNIHYYGLYYTVIKIRNEREIVNNKYEDIENDYNILNDFVIPNQYVGRKHNCEKLRQRHLKSPISHFK